MRARTQKHTNGRWHVSASLTGESTGRHVSSPFCRPFSQNPASLLHHSAGIFAYQIQLWQQAGLPSTADGGYHLPRSAAVQDAFEKGVPWPRWFPESHSGRGEATFHYYSPGLYWLVGAVHWAGIGLDQALTLVVTAAFILSGLGVYGWLRHTFSRKASLVSAAVYLGMPHIYSRTFLHTGDYPQLLAILIFSRRSVGVHRSTLSESRWLLARECFRLGRLGIQPQPASTNRRGRLAHFLLATGCWLSQMGWTCTLRSGGPSGSNDFRRILVACVGRSSPGAGF